MADSNIAITAGSGTNVDTRTNAGGDHRQVIIVGDQTANDAIAVVTSADAGVATSEYGMVVRPLMTDGAKLRVSAILDNGSVSAKSSDAATMRMSAINSISSLSPAADLFRVSAFVNEGSISAKSGDAANLNVSAKSNDGALLRTSAVQDGAAALNVSAKSDSAALFRVSADLFPNTVGGLSIFRSLNLSASQAIKAAAGALYGYYLYNTDTKPQYVKMFNTSGAISVGTDTPILTIMLPASAAANVEFPHGLIGFTAGIGVAALSAVADNATTPAASSAVGGNFFYK